MLNNSIENFVFDDKAVQVIVRKHEPWFVASQVCRVLGLTNPTMALENLDDDEKDTVNLREWAEQNGGSLSSTDGTPDLGGNPNVNIISESGLFTLVLRSRKAVTPGTVEHRFRKWVTHEVLPAIRRHGGYGHNSGAREPIEDGVHPQDISFAEKLRAVELAMRVHGRARARVMWRTMGLPAVPEAPPTIHDEALVCLRHLLDFIVTDIDGEQARIRDLIDEAIDDNEGSRQLIMRHGVKLHHSGRGFVVANCGDGIARIYGGTRWAKGRHYWMLRKLAGVKANGNTKFFGVTHKATFVPMKYLDEGAPAPDLDLAG